MIVAFIAGLMIGTGVGIITIAIITAGAREDSLREELHEREGDNE